VNKISGLEFSLIVFSQSLFLHCLNKMWVLPGRQGPESWIFNACLKIQLSDIFRFYPTPAYQVTRKSDLISSSKSLCCFEAPSLEQRNGSNQFTVVSRCLELRMNVWRCEQVLSTKCRQKSSSLPLPIPLSPTIRPKVMDRCTCVFVTTCPRFSPVLIYHLKLNSLPWITIRRPTNHHLPRHPNVTI